MQGAILKLLSGARSVTGTRMEISHGQLVISCSVKGVVRQVYSKVSNNLYQSNFVRHGRFRNTIIRFLVRSSLASMA